MDAWGIVQFCLYGLPLPVAALIGRSFQRQRRERERKAMEVLKAIGRDNEPLASGRMTLSGVVRARTAQPPIEGCVRYRVMPHNQWVEVERKLRARSFDLVLPERHQVVRVDLRRGSQWSLQCASVQERDPVELRELIELRDGEQVVVEGRLQERRTPTHEQRGYRDAKPTSWTLKADKQPLSIRAASAAKAQMEARSWPRPVPIFLICVIALAVINVAVSIVTESTAQDLAGIANVREVQKKGKSGKYTVTLMDISYTDPAGTARTCTDLPAPAGVISGQTVQVRASSYLPDACYQVGRYRAQSWRLIGSFFTFLALAVFLIAEHVSKKDGYLIGKPWFER